MNTRTRLVGIGLAILALSPCAVVTAQTGGQPPPNGGIEVQPRGPLHESFVQPFDPNPGPGPAYGQAPPAPIPEKPADIQPGSESAQWIPGYWAWDANRNDFVWVSGTYRNAPPGRRFIPGQWTNTPDGWRWVAGYWAPENQGDIQLAAQPPASLEVGPSMPPPDDNSSYVPGYWAYQNDTFIWRPGFYAPLRAGRTWVQPRYIWTPNGYLYNSGYWDYPLVDRGLLFAPVWFNGTPWRTAGWYYRPNHVMPLNGVHANLQHVNQLALTRPANTGTRIVAGAGVPRVVNNSLATPRVVHSAVVSSAIHTAPARVNVAPARAGFTAAATQHHVAASTAVHAGRPAAAASHAHATVSHGRSGGGGHGRR